MEALSITILGGDLRQCYAAEYFAALGWNVMCYHTPNFPHQTEVMQAGCLEQALEHSDLLLAPTPLTRNKTSLFQAETDFPPCPLEELWERLTSKHKFFVCSPSADYQKILENVGCQILDFGKFPFFQQENAKLTAEGLLAEVIRCTPFALSSANILLLGYGCCGTAIGRLFLPLCQNIYVIEHDTEKLNTAKIDGLVPISRKNFDQMLPECQLLINTVPAPVLETTHLLKLHSSCHIFDIASAPFGFPADTTEKCLMPYYRISGIPGRFSPATAGGIIGRTIERMTEHAL